MWRQERTGWASLMVFFVALMVSCSSNNNQPSTNSPKSDSHYTIAILSPGDFAEPIIEGFRAELASQGYEEGENLTYIYNGATAADKIEEVALSFLEVNVDLIFSVGTPATQALQEVFQDTDIPIVFGPMTDPVDAGVVDDLSHPGGNITGVMFGAQGGRGFQFLIQLIGEGKTVLIPFNPEDDSSTREIAVVEALAPEINTTLIPVEVLDDDAVLTLIDELPPTIDAIYIPADNLVLRHEHAFAQAAIDLKLPLAVPSNTSVIESGALFSLSTNLMTIGKQSAQLAVRILKGDNPAILPVVSAENELVINLQTAEIIDLQIPDEILRQADQIIRD